MLLRDFFILPMYLIFAAAAAAAEIQLHVVVQVESYILKQYDA